jgi:iron complex outermembrane receptor protein
MMWIRTIVGSVGISILIVAPGAAAAEPPPPDTVAHTPDLSAAELARLAEQAAQGEVITVTGSAIERKSLTTPAPVTIITRDQLDAAGRTTLGEILQQLPANANGSNAQINSGSDGSTRINLRGLGANRTLTLLNGRRVAPSGVGANDSVDIDSIPLALVERVEILKDGASAIYGSDAVGGVVNIITRSSFNGAQAELYTGASARGDGFDYSASVTAGHDLADHKGNLMFSAGFQRKDPIFAADRAFSRQDHDFDYATRTPFVLGSTASAGGRVDAFHIDTAGDGVGAPVDLCGAGVQFCTSNGRGGFRPFDPATDQYNYQSTAYLYTPSTRYNIFSAGNYQLTPSVTAFYEASYVNSSTSQQLAPVPFDSEFSAPVSKASLYNPTGGDVLDDTRRLVELGPRHTSELTATFQAVTGVRGTFDDASPILPRGKWEVSYSYGRSNASTTTTGDLVTSRLANAVGPSFRDPTGTPTCGTPDAPIADCVPLDVLGAAGAIDPRARAYVTYTGVGTGYNEQHMVAATAHGQLVALPHHGDISVAVGADYRYQAGGNFPDSLSATGGTPNVPVPPIEGTSEVGEGYGELSIVPLAGNPIAQWVELDLAARGFHYGSFGSGVTWKAGGLIRTVNGIALRGTYSTAFRAPSISELFFTQTFDSPQIEDPCDTRPPSAGGAVVPLDPAVAARCKRAGVPADAAFGTSAARVRSGGNPALGPEKARTLTAGVVLEPPRLPGLAITADYWRIALSQAIQAFSPETVLQNCYQGGVQSFCHLVHRDPANAGAIDLIDATNVNVGSITTSGLDTDVAYDHAFGGLGRLHAELVASYLFQFNLDDTSRIVRWRGVYDGGVNPTLKLNLSGSLAHPSGITGGFAARYIGGFKECEFDDCADGLPSRDVAAWYVVDLFASYAFHDPLGLTSLTIGANNALDRRPPVIYFGNEGDSDGTAYDLTGRLFYLRLSQRF